MNEDKTVEGEPDQQHKDSELDENNDEEHKDQSCRSEKEDIENKTEDCEIENCEDADDDNYVRSIQGETAETEREILCLLVKAAIVVNEEWSLKDELQKHNMKNSHDISCTKCDENFITEEELGRHMNNEHTTQSTPSTTDNDHVTLEKEEDSLNNSNKEHFDARHNFKCENCEEIEKGFAKERLKFEQDLAKTREEYEKVKSELELTKEANDSLTKMEKIELNKDKEKKASKAQPEDVIEA